ncbi:tRNA 2-thiocytidine(32) synthetase TtcA [Ferrovum sp. PN-J185]|uniref:tRNA 2-thiocytidine(32) synthetase TtcA n=1 Tax=Ferrovum sp. PN-J185 TaxID=1356306 RepID=UPI00079609CF|nr:tRNA 2-thiocytidine(32) synthetase TtcA [Ferrovum sp. PN-J185]KXW56153.1 tRNA 2-thiocytidine biosynthesis protein TtcA [Ferrovum sp. PN-J185]MCC6067785.1 tRNA 2-thiocytidine(32) synthetase TtcA [Ferrovum sp. PN-J185]MDE1892197.1 tRNA 2-thiocytidine(32) synthetase TtcA [Betaproteobacteria bacterium]
MTFSDVPLSANMTRLKERLLTEMGKAIGDYQMIDNNDRLMVCLSGGKDSHTLLDLLLEMKKRAPIHFDIIAVNLDQKQPGFPEHTLPHYLEQRGVDYRIIEADTYSLVKEKIPAGKTTCSLCSRLRRGILYRSAKELKATKIVLGHHQDDILQTFFLNLFYGGRLKGMPAKLVSDDGHHVVIRPLAYSREKDIARYAKHRNFPIIPCDLCGSQDNLKRQQIKEWLTTMERDFPGRINSITQGLQQVSPSHLNDRNLFDFTTLKATGQTDQNGDTLFDEQELERGAFRLNGQEDKRIHFMRVANSDKLKD